MKNECTFALFNLLFHKLHMNAHSHVVGGCAFLTGSESSSECARGVSLHRIDNSHSTLLSRVIGLLNVFYASTEVLLKENYVRLDFEHCWRAAGHMSYGCNQRSFYYHKI